MKFIEVFSGVEIITPTTVCQSVLGDAYPQGGGSWNPVLNEYFSEKFPLYMCSPDTPIHIKKSQKNVLSHLRQLCIFCVTFKVCFLPVSRDTLLGFIELISRTCGFDHVQHVLSSVKFLHEFTGHQFPGDLIEFKVFLRWFQSRESCSIKWCSSG